MTTNNALDLIEEIKQVTDDLRLVCVDSEAEILELKKLSGKTTRRSSKASSNGNLNSATCEAFCVSMEEHEALVENKIGSHEKTTMEDKEGMASFLTFVWQKAGRKGEFKAYRNSILIPV